MTTIYNINMNWRSKKKGFMLQAIYIAKKRDQYMKEYGMGKVEAAKKIALEESVTWRTIYRYIEYGTFLMSNKQNANK